MIADAPHGPGAGLSFSVQPDEAAVAARAAEAEKRKSFKVRGAGCRGCCDL